MKKLIILAFIAFAINVPMVYSMSYGSMSREMLQQELDRATKEMAALPKTAAPAAKRAVANVQARIDQIRAAIAAWQPSGSGETPAQKKAREDQEAAAARKAAADKAARDKAAADEARRRAAGGTSTPPSAGAQDILARSDSVGKLREQVIAEAQNKMDQLSDAEYAAIKYNVADQIDIMPKLPPRS